MAQNISVVWFEIPAADLDRATGFYKKVLQTNLVPMETPSGVVQTFINGEMPVGALVQNDNAQPSTAGSLVYLNTDDIDAALGRVEAAGGKVLLPKTSIGPHGNIAQFTDSENNRVALHSA